jgi:hypothetical protein
VKRSTLRALLATTFGVLVMAIVILRFDETDGADDDSLLVRAAMGVFWAGVTVGLAFVSELIIRAIPVALHVRRELKRRKAEWKTPSRARAAAAKAIKEINDNDVRRTHWVERARGRYYTIWKNHRAAVTQSDPSSPVRL